MFLSRPGSLRLWLKLWRAPFRQPDDRGIVHRDMKPANVLFNAHGTAKITDFGLAKQLDDVSGQTHTGAVMGTPSYMAPEQRWAKPSASAPRPTSTPWELFSTNASRADHRFAVPPCSTLSIRFGAGNRCRCAISIPMFLETWKRICLKCLNKEPGKRYASAAALAEDLRRFLAGESILARPAGRTAAPLGWCRRNPALAATGALAGLALIGAVVVSLAYAFEQSRNADYEAQNQPEPA